MGDVCDAVRGCVGSAQEGRLTAEEAGELLGISARHFRRMRSRYEVDGVDGLRDRRLGRVSGRRAAESELERMRRLYREEYADFTAKHFREELRKRHNYTLGYTVTRLALQSAGLLTKAKRPLSIARSVHAGRCRGDAAVPRRLDASLDRRARSRPRLRGDAG
jgi:transposase